MKSPRHQLILLGLICQGLSWDDFVLPLLSAALWLAGLQLGRKPRNISPAAEMVLLAGGAAAAYFINVAFGQSPHFFIGYGLSLIQVARLMRPLLPRDKMLTVAIALVQIGVATTVVTDYRFIPILLACVLLTPRALSELAVELFASKPQSANGVRPAFGWGAYGVVAGVMTIAFLVLPRGILGTPFGVARPSRGTAGSLEDSVMDPSRSAQRESGRVVFQVQGERVGYFKCHVFAEYDGSRWSNQQNQLRWLGDSSLQGKTNGLHRQVRVKDVRYLGRVLPADGRVAAVRGQFFRRPMRNSYDIIQCEFMMNSAKNTYDYWLDPAPGIEELNERQRVRYTTIPKQSVRLRAWLDRTVEGAASGFEQARKIELILRNQFEYQLGAPVLDRLNPIDDFIFNRKEGHCERFASALAVLLRMQGIPARVAIGYVPSPPNWLSGWRSVRFRDAHAWTEAWFEQRGWTPLDATPRSTLSAPGQDLTDWIDAVDGLWFTHVTSYDGASQQQLLGAVTRTVARALDWMREHANLLLGALAFFGAGAMIWRRRAAPAPLERTVDPVRAAIEASQQHYALMLERLAALGIPRRPDQTPFEFSALVRQREFPASAEVDWITHQFCAACYGEIPATAADTVRTENALRRLNGGLESAQESV